MAAAYRKFTYEQVAEGFIYDPETGELWRRLANGEVRALTMAREDRDHYRAVALVKFRGQQYQIPATYICFMLMEHRWPKPGLIVDHRDDDVFNCRWSNLREGTRRQNMMKQTRPGPMAQR